ncbi:MAG: hypothetical protein AABX79_02140 [Nanoarchaeota archaeon]
MKPSHYIEKVKKSPAYKLLMEEDSKAYLCSIFFLRDFDEGNNETQVDFYSPLKKHLISFKIDKQVEKVENKHAKTITGKKFIPQPLPENIKMDVDEMKSTILDEMHNRDMTYEIEKVLAFLNVTDGAAVWNCTGFLKGLGLVQAHVEDKSASVLFMEKKSLFDLIKFPGGAPGMKGMPGMAGAGFPDKPMGNVVIMGKPEQVAPEPKEESKPETKEPKQKSAKTQEPIKKKDSKSKQ